MINSTFEDFVNAAFSDLREMVEQHPSPGKLQQIADRLEGYAIHLLRIAVYIDARAYFVMSHERAVDRSNGLAAKVRKALGYSYPKQDISF